MSTCRIASSHNTAFVPRTELSSSVTEDASSRTVGFCVALAVVRVGWALPSRAHATPAATASIAIASETPSESRRMALMPLAAERLGGDAPDLGIRVLQHA